MMATMLSMSVRNGGIVSFLDFDGTNLGGLGGGGCDGGRRYHGGNRSGRDEDQDCGEVVIAQRQSWRSTQC